MWRVVSAFLALVSTSILCAAQTPLPPRDTSGQTGTAIIRGHVFDGATGQPLRKAQVRALSPELRENRLASTDANGAYEIRDLAAGRYTLSASKGTYVNLSYGQTRPFEPGKPVELRNAQLLDKVDFNLPRAAVISGRVVDEYGEPIEEVQVMAMRYQYLQGSRQLTTTRSGMTNDVGEFRIYGLPPGQYVLSATYRATNFDPFGNSSSADRDRDRSGYAPTYYPGTANAADAQRLPVGLGQKISDVTIALLPTRLARISGTAVDSDGHAFTNATVMMTQPSTGGMLSSGGPVRADGTFVINNVAPGDYTLVILPRSVPGAGPSNESVQANVSVNGDDVDNVRLVAVKPSKLTGRVIPAASQTNVNLSSLRLVATPASPQRIGIGGTNGPARVNEDGTFELSASPGKAFIRMNVAGPFANTRIKAVRLNGVDVIDTGIEFRPNENIDGVEVELTTELSNLSGGVTDARGNAVRDYTVITFARDREKWGPGSRYMNSARPNQDGRYKINLPQGDYYAVALDYVEQGSQTDPEFLERLKERATEFSINEAESKGLDLKLVTGL
ncbi:MAG TPA: carboxypeptidase-like regulatory domain-containing protein [Vicinamibacterales bacterium]|nr:carboxypeptidase-like regulatory domain-containing protein [Vicinamibacterales bacterium]